MVTLTLKKLPEGLHERLRDRAARHHRSLNAEVIACLEAAVQPARVDPDELLTRARALRERVRGTLRDRLLQELKEAGRP